MKSKNAHLKETFFPSPKAGSGKIAHQSTVWVIPLLLLMVLIFVFSLRQMSDADLGFHLHAGKWITDNQRWPSGDTFTYTVTGNDYVDLHWLFQLSLYGLYSLAGYPALSLWMAALVTVLFFLIFLRTRLLCVPMPVTIILVLISAVCMQSRFLMRPELITYLLLTWTLLVLDGYYHNKTRSLYLLPVIQLLWVNHHGLFILGWFLAGAYYLSVLIRDKKNDRYFLTWTLGSFATSLVNPYFIKGITFPFYLLTRFSRENPFNNIQEFRPVFESTEPYSVSFILFYLFLLLGIVSFFLTVRKRTVHEALILLVFMVLALTGMRNIPLYILVSVPIIGAGIRDFYHSRLSGKGWLHAGPIGLVIGLVLALYIVLLTLRILTGAFYADQRFKFRTGAGIDRNELEVDACAYIRQNLPEGRIMNDLNTGGWLGWSLGRPVFVDGRLEVMKEDFYREYTSLYSMGGLKYAVTKYKPDIIVYDYESNVAWDFQMREMKEWCPVYLDENVVIFTRASSALQGDTAVYEKFASGRFDVSLEDDSAVWKILRTGREHGLKHWLVGLVKKTSYYNPLYIRPALHCHRLGHRDAAEKLYLGFLAHDRGRLPWIYQNLGLVYYQKHDYAKARYCFEKLLGHDRKNKIARQYLKEMRKI
jgi:tetratricopeptide (TPR) repeat protein